MQTVANQLNSNTDLDLSRDTELKMTSLMIISPFLSCQQYEIAHMPTSGISKKSSNDRTGMSVWMFSLQNPADTNFVRD